MTDTPTPSEMGGTPPPGSEAAATTPSAPTSSPLTGASAPPPASPDPLAELGHKILDTVKAVIGGGSLGADALRAVGELESLLAGHRAEVDAAVAGIKDLLSKL